jgi:hypothetical protein
MTTTARIHFEPTWITIPSPNPRDTIEVMRRQVEAGHAARAAARREMEGRGSCIYRLVSAFNEQYGETAARRAASAAGLMPGGGWNWYDARFMIAECLGAPEPQWNLESASWWQDHEHHLQWVQTAADVSRIAVPDWRKAAPVAHMLEAHERWVQAFPSDSGWNAVWYMTLPSGRCSPEGGEPVAGIGYPSFVDLGIFLLGVTNFLTIVGGDEEMADALMDKCFELSTSYVEFYLTIHKSRWEAMLGFGGDMSCLLSPRLYERYGIGWDARLFDFVRRHHDVPATLPCNMHSCGPSPHLYNIWGRHPHRDNIVTIQTRLLPGQVERLRQSLPTTFLELTIHPQHFDLAGVQPGEVKRVLVETARDAGWRDVSITIFAVAHTPENLPALEANILACDEAMQEVNQST